MEKDELLLDPKWISSFYALVATAVCTLIFTYKGVDFFEAFIKTFFTVISFYLFGIATAAVINFYYLKFIKPKEELEEEKLEKEQSEQGDDQEELEQSEQLEDNKQEEVSHQEEVAEESA